jgi:hypothetical protein
VTGKPIRPSEHDLHERLLVVRFATNDELEPDEIARARALVASCPGCAALASDVKAISRATASSMTPSRPRDFRLTPEQAAAAHGSRIRGWLAALTSPGMGMLRPLAGVAVALGLLLVVAGGGLPGFGGATNIRTGSTSGAPVDTSRETAATSPETPVVAAASPAASADSGPSVPPPLSATQGTTMPTVPTDAALPGRTPRPNPETDKTPQESEASGQVYQAATTTPSEPPSPSEPPKVGLAAGATTQPTPAPAAAQPTSAPVAAPAAPVESPPNGGSPLALLGLLLGIVGLAVLALAWVARRVTKDPLLR